MLTSGRAKTVGTIRGVDGNGATQAQSALADNGWNLPGDANLATAIGSPYQTLMMPAYLNLISLHWAIALSSIMYLAQKNTLLLLYVLLMMRLPFYFRTRYSWFKKYCPGS